MKALPDYTVQLCDPARPMTVVNVGSDRRRWEIMLMPGDDPARLTEPDIFWPMMKRWLGPEDAVLERAAVYTFHSVVQEGWRKGNLLLAGDACHQTPPFLGQGMCAGMRDAANLAWKLEAVLRDGAPDSLLDTYESERRPHVETFIELAVKLGAVLQETDPAKAAERDRRFATGAEMFDFPQPQLGPGCRADAPPPVGTIFPQPRAAGRPTDGRGDRPALRHRRRRRAARRSAARRGDAARRRRRLAGAARPARRTAPSGSLHRRGRVALRQRDRLHVLLEARPRGDGRVPAVEVLEAPCRSGASSRKRHTMMPTGMSP